MASAAVVVVVVVVLIVCPLCVIRVLVYKTLWGWVGLHRLA